MENHVIQPALGRAKSPPAWRVALAAYGFAITVSGLTLLARLSLEPWLGKNPVLVLFILPIIFSAYVGGLGPGLLATAICTWGSYHFLRTTEYILYFEGSVDLWQWVILIVIGMLISFLMEALRRSQKRAEIAGQLHAVTLASIGDAVISTDAQGGVTFLNSEAERLTGWTSAAAAGQPLPTVFHIVNQATREPVEDPVKKVFRTGMVVGLANHTVLIARDGREFVIDDSGAPIRGADGKIIGVVLVFRDNTAKKQAEDAVRESQALYHSLVNQMPAGIFRKDAAGRYVFVNTAFCQLKGKPPEYFLGKTAAELGPEEAHQAASRTNHHAQIMQTGRPVEVEEKHVRADGRTLFFHVVKTPVFNAEETITGTQGVLLDVTERKQAEAALLESQALYHSLVDQMPVGVFRKDAAGRYVFVNSFFCRLRNAAPEFFLGKLPAELPAAEDPFKAEAAQHHAEIMQTGRAIEVLDKYHRQDGQTLFFQVVKTPVFDANGSITGSQGILFDVTAREEAEAALRESEVRFRTLVEQASDAIFVHDVDGRLLDANQSACEKLGYTRPEILKLTVTDLEQGMELAEARAIWRKLRPGQAQMVRGQHRRKDGTVFPVEVNVTCYELHGRTVLAALARDISFRLEYEEKMARSVSLLRATIESSASGILAVDLNGKVAAHNQRFLQLWNLPAALAETAEAEALLEQARQQLADPDAAWRRVREIYAQPETESFDTLRFKDGRVFERSSQPQRLGEKIIGRVWSFWDITERRRAETALRQERELLRTLVDLAPDFIFVKDTEGRYLVVNAALAACYNQTPAAMLGRTDADFLPAELAGRCRAPELQVMAAASFRTFEDVVGFPDGKVRAVMTNMVAFRDAQGKAGGLVGIGRDVTAQKAIEKSMRLQSVALEAAANSILITDHNGTIEWVNPALTRSTGYTLAECLGKNPRELLHSGHHDKQFFRQLWETILAGRVWHGEIVNRRKDGSLLLEAMTITPLVDRENRTTHFIAIRQDITERKAVEQQLRHLAVIVESSEDAIMSKTLDGVIMSWNRGAEIVFGYPASEMIGQPMRLLFPEELKNEESDILARIARGESVKHFETERVRKDGTLIRISATISPLKDAQGRVVGASTIARDTTRQHVLEEQLRQSQKMEAIGQLAGGVAHDFNNILAVIQMQAELSKIEGNFTREQLACLDEIQVAANRAAKLTRQLLLFSRRQRLQPRELDLSDSITGMAKMLRRILGEDIQMHFKYAPQPLFILADASTMDQVLMNLALNSRDAMPKGGQLVIETAAVEFDRLAAAQITNARPGAFVRLSVSDTGCGIAPEIMPRIFEPFFTTKDVGKGTGLGLATVFSIVQQHQGWISVTSKPGQGTTFHIYLPRLSKISARPPAVESALAAASGGDETILLVEDDDSLRASVRKSLAQLGYRLLEAANGVEALQVWHQHGLEIDLLLTDLVMPGGMSGKDLAGRLLQENPQLKVIYASGYSAEVAGKDFPLVEGVNFLSKPFPVQTLARAIRASLDAN